MGKTAAELAQDHGYAALAAKLQAAKDRQTAERKITADLLVVADISNNPTITAVHVRGIEMSSNTEIAVAIPADQETTSDEKHTKNKISIIGTEITKPVGGSPNGKISGSSANIGGVITRITTGLKL